MVTEVAGVRVGHWSDPAAGTIGDILGCAAGAPKSARSEETGFLRAQVRHPRRRVDDTFILYTGPKTGGHG